MDVGEGCDDGARPRALLASGGVAQTGDSAVGGHRPAARFRAVQCSVINHLSPSPIETATCPYVQLGSKALIFEA